MKKRIIAILLLLGLSGCAFGQLNPDDDSAWFIGWGNLKKGDMEISSASPLPKIEIGD